MKKKKKKKFNITKNRIINKCAFKEAKEKFLDRRKNLPTSIEFPQKNNRSLIKKLTKRQIKILYNIIKELKNDIKRTSF
jgi:hypothetical protein